MLRRRKDSGLHPHVIHYRASGEMLSSIKEDIESGRASGIGNVTDVIHAALTDRYSKEENFQDSITRQLGRFQDSITRRLDRQKTQMQILDARLERLEKIIVTYLRCLKDRPPREAVPEAAEPVKAAPPEEAADSNLIL